MIVEAESGKLRHSELFAQNAIGAGRSQRARKLIELKKRRKMR